MWIKRRKLGSHKSFAEDVEFAIQAAQDQKIEGLPHLLLYSLLYATLGSFATNVTTKMLLVLYNWKELERALSYVELMAEPEKRAYAFLTLGCHSEPFDLIGGMERRGKPDGGLLKRAFQEAQDIEDIEKRAHFLSSLAPELARAGEVEAAFAAAELIDREWPDEFVYQKREAFAKIPIRLAWAGKPEEALQSLNRIDEEWRRSAQFLEVIRALAEGGRINEALHISYNSPAGDEALRRVAWGCHVDDEVLVRKIQKLRTQVDKTQLPNVLAEIATILLQVKQKYENEYQSDFQESQARNDDLGSLLWLGKYDEVLSRISTNEKYLKHYTNDKAFSLFLDGLLITGREKDAEALVADEWDDSKNRKKLERWKTAWMPLRNLIMDRKLDEVIKAISEIQSVGDMARALVVCGPMLARSGRFSGVLELFERYKDESSFELQAEELAIHLAREGLFAEAELFVNKVLDDYFLRSTFIEIAGALAGFGKYQAIVPTAKRLMKKPTERCDALAEVVTRLTAVDRAMAHEILEATLIDAESPQSGDLTIAETLASIAIQLARHGKLEQAGEISRSFMLDAPEAWAEIAIESAIQSNASEDISERISSLVRSTKQVVDSPNLVYSQKEVVLHCLASSLARRSRFDLAEIVTESMDGKHWQKSITLVELAGRIGTTNPEHGRRLFNSALRLVEEMCEPGQEDLYTGDPTSQNGVEEEHHPVQEVRSSMFVSLFLSSNRLMQWIFLSESLQDFMGHGIRFEEAKTWLVAELLKAGWTAEALAIAETLQGKDAKDQIRGYAAIQLARKGEFDKAYKLMTNLEDAGSSYGYWQVTGHEVSDTRIAVQAIEFERLLISEDIAGAQRIALDLWANIQMQRKCYTHWSMYSQVKDW